jgi:hypothetical protein
MSICSRSCAACGSLEVNIRCSRCNAAFYCNEVCHESHWLKSHSKSCCSQQTSGAIIGSCTDNKSSGVSCDSSNRWTSEKKEQLVKFVHEGPLDTDWNKVGEFIGRTASVSYHQYLQIVKPEEDVQNRLFRASTEELKQIIRSKGSKCETCNIMTFSPLVEWRGINECTNCHSLHKEEIAEIWKTIEPHTSCAFCERVKCPWENFHFDHLNMFEKGDSICKMIQKGVSIEEIVSECKKCQVLCISCHSVKTEIEIQLGFSRLKKGLTRKINGNSKDGKDISIEDLKKSQDEYIESYRLAFEPLIPLIKEMVRI